MSNGPMKNLHSAAALGLQLAAWLSDTGNVSFSLSKRFKDKETGEWKDTKYLLPSDLAALVELANRGLLLAADHYDRRREANKQNGTPNSHAEAPRNTSTTQAQTNFADDDIPF